MPVVCGAVVPRGGGGGGGGKGGGGYLTGPLEPSPPRFPLPPRFPPSTLFRVQELCENRGGRPGFPVPNKPSGLCGHKAALTPPPHTHTHTRTHTSQTLLTLTTSAAESEGPPADGSTEPHWRRCPAEAVNDKKAAQVSDFIFHPLVWKR